MDDSVDKQLADHLRQTLDGYQAPYQLGAWEQFDRARQPAKRRLGGWYRYVAAACALGGLLLAPLWLDDARLPSPNASGLPTNRTTQPDRAFNHKKQSPSLPAISTPPSGEPVVAAPQSKPQNRPIAGGSPVRLAMGKTPSSAAPGGARFVPTNKSSDAGIASKSGKPNNAGIAGQSGFDSSGVNRQWVTVPLNQPLNPVRNEAGQLATAPVASTPAVTPTMPVSVATAVAMNEPASPTTKRERRRAVTWSLALAPQTAYIPNGRSSLTVGGGVVSDIALSRRFSVSTGLAVAQQRVGFAPPANQVMTTSLRQLTGTNARLMLIDLPLNLTYQVGKQTKPLFRVSAGLSSLAFLSQQYTDTFQTPQIRITPVTTPTGTPQAGLQTTMIETVQTRPQMGFGGIYWGRLLNLSVGIERTLSPKMVFAVEPYLKYPLGPLTQDNLSIGSAGVSLRVGIR